MEQEEVADLEIESMQVEIENLQDENPSIFSI